MKKFSLFLILFSMVLTASWGKSVTIEDLESLIEKGDYNKVLVKIHKSLVTDELTPTERGRLLNLEGRMFEEYGANLDRGIHYYKQTLGLDLADNHPVVREANDSINRINRLKLSYKEELDFFKKINGVINTQPVGGEAYNKLTNLVEIVKDDSIRALSHFYLSKIYMAHNDYLESYKEARKALTLKPLMDLFQPVTVTMKDAYVKYYTEIVKNVTFVIGILVLLFILVFFYRSKPWQWVTWKHILLYVIMVAVFMGIFTGIVYIIGISSSAAVENFTAPVFVNTFFDGYGDHVLNKFMVLMFFGICFSTLFAFGAMSQKRRYSWKVLGMTLSVFLFMSVVSTFYYGFAREYGVMQGAYSFYPSDDNEDFSFLNGAAYFKIREAKPYVLTNPRDHLNLNITMLNEDIFIDWVKKHYKVIEGEQGEK